MTTTQPNPKRNETISLFLDIFSRVLKNNNIPEENAATLAELLVFHLSEELGGLQFYLPRDANNKRGIRNKIIIKQLNSGMSADQVARYYRLSVKQICEIRREASPNHLQLPASQP